MGDGEAAEALGGGPVVVALGDEAGEAAFGDALEEGLEFAFSALGDEFDAAVGEVADLAGDVVAASEPADGGAEADALDTAAVVGGDALGCGRGAGVMGLGRAHSKLTPSWARSGSTCSKSQERTASLVGESR
jgi:hypothetical protein